MDENFDIKGNTNKRQNLYFSLLYFAVVLGYPISSYISDALNIQSNNVSILSRILVVLLAINYWLFIIRKKLFVVTTPFLLFVLFWTIYSVRILYDTILFGSQLGRPVTDYYLFGFVLSLFVSIPLFTPVNLETKKLEVFIFLGLFITNIIAVKNNLNAEQLFVERIGGNDKLNPITAGMQAAYLFLISILYLFFKKNTNYFLKIGGIFGISISIFNLIATSSKSSFLFIIIAFFCLVFISGKTFKKATLAITMMVVIYFTAIKFIPHMSDYLELAFKRFEFFSTDLSAEDRKDSYSDALKQFLNSPILGSFLEEKNSRQYPHNAILEAFMAIGIFGGSIFLLVLSKYFQALMIWIKNYPTSILPFIALSTFTLSFTSGGLSFSSDFWQQMAISFSVLSLFKSKKTKSLIFKKVLNT